MSGKYPPVSCKDFKRALKNLGFACREQEGSHEQWVHDCFNGKFRKVTVDCPKSPFHRTLLAYMLNQAGLSKDELYAAINA